MSMCTLDDANPDTFEREQMVLGLIPASAPTKESGPTRLDPRLLPSPKVPGKGVSVPSSELCSSRERI